MRNLFRVLPLLCVLAHFLMTMLFPHPLIDFPIGQIAGTGGIRERNLRSGPRKSKIAHQESALGIDVLPVL